MQLRAHIPGQPNTNTHIHTHTPHTHTSGYINGQKVQFARVKYSFFSLFILTCFHFKNGCNIMTLCRMMAPQANALTYTRECCIFVV